MSKETKEILIQRYMQGDMPPDERAAFREQLQDDPELRALLEQYSLLLHDLQDLGLPRMPADLWQRKIKPAVEANIERPETFWTRMRRFFHGFIPKAARPAIAAIAFVAVIVAVTFFMQQQISTIYEEPYARELAQIEKIRNDYAAVLSTLQRDANDHVKQMSPDLREAYAASLKKMDDAIADAERLYSIYSDDEDAINGLITAYDNKSEFLRNWLNINAVMQ